MATRGFTRDKVDRDLLHEFLWKKSDRNHLIQMSQGALADMLGITIYSLSHIFGELRDDGRIKKVGTKYEVVDPSIYGWNKPKKEEADERLF